MSQRLSGYTRKGRDAYETPEWVTQALLPHLPARKPKLIWEPATGSGKMAKVLRELGRVFESDITSGDDFLALPVDVRGWPNNIADAIITNPPYSLAIPFIEKALVFTRPLKGFVAMLFRTDFDHPASRKHLFGDCPQFSKKVVLRKRIVWFEGPKANPSFNHAWFIWDWKHKGPPILAYGP